SSRAKWTSGARRGASRATRCSVGSGPATSWPTATRGRTGSLSTRPSGTTTGGAAILVVRTAWRIAATNPLPCWRRWSRSVNRFVRRSRHDEHAKSTGAPRGGAMMQRVIATPLLDELRGPEDLRGLDHEQLRALAAEIRAYLVEAVSATGGHLGSNLGVVE